MWEKDNENNKYSDFMLCYRTALHCEISIHFSINIVSHFRLKQKCKFKDVTTSLTHQDPKFTDQQSNTIIKHMSHFIPETVKTIRRMHTFLFIKKLFFFLGKIKSIFFIFLCSLISSKTLGDSGLK